MKDSTTNTAARELLDGIEGDYAVCMGVSEQSYRQFCDSGALGRMPNDTWAVHCHARKAQIDQLRALLAKSAAYEALVAEIESAPAVGIEDVEIDGEVYRAAFDDDKQFAIGSRVRLLLVREGVDGK